MHDEIIVRKGTDINFLLTEENKYVRLQLSDYLAKQ